MPSAVSRWTHPVGDAFWTSVRYFNVYRLILAAFLLAIGLASPAALGLGEIAPRLFVIGGGAYLAATVLMHVALVMWRRAFSVQLGLQVLTDVVGISVMMHATGGHHGGLGVVLLISLAGAALVADRMLVMLLASIATIAVLLQQAAWIGLEGVSSNAMLAPALLGAGFFATALITNRLAERVVANEELARHRGEELDNQIRVNALVIQDLQDGLLVLDEHGIVRQHNPRASRMCGPGAAVGRAIAEFAPALALEYRAWRDSAGTPADAECEVVLVSRTRARFHAVGVGDRRFALVYLEDLARVEAEAQTLKLVALGRLTASIAHEIRNPLSAITHASDLLGEENRAQGRVRLVRIIRDNAYRLDRMVTDVLELNRRDRAVPEPIELREYVDRFVEESIAKGEIEPGMVRIGRSGVAGEAGIVFDRVHLHQILWNLLRNARRHASGDADSVRIETTVHDDHVELQVHDDGPGIPVAARPHLFEPFFTTESRGTGLGLYISRELAVANGAALDFLPGEGGAVFRLQTRRSER